MEQFYKDLRTPLRMREGPLGAYVDALAQQLSDEGYAKASVRQALQLASDFGRWLRRRRMIASQLTPERLQCYLEYRSRHRRRGGESAVHRSLGRAPAWINRAARHRLSSSMACALRPWMDFWWPLYAISTVRAASPLPSPKPLDSRCRSHGAPRSRARFPTRR